LPAAHDEQDAEAVPLYLPEAQSEQDVEAVSLYLPAGQEVAQLEPVKPVLQEVQVQDLAYPPTVPPLMQ